MIDEFSATTAPDAIATLLRQIRSGSVDVRERAARDMLTAVHRAVYPMCLKLLGDADDAYEAEAESIARLLARADDRGTAPIANGTAYVRQIARNVCHDLHRASRRRHDHSVDDLDESQVPAIADHAATMSTPVAAPTPLDHDLIATFGYTSKRALADLESLTRPELSVVVLRQEGYSYPKIAAIIGAGLTTRTAEKHGERGLHKLRGLAHVGVWRQKPLTAWADPPCPALAELQHQVQQHLRDGRQITATLYLQIGRHLDPAPNRRPGDKRVRLCPKCARERERSRREYWWLLIMLMPFPASASPPALRPVALSTVDGAPMIAPRRRTRTWWAAAASVLLLLLLLAVGALVAPRVPASTAALMHPFGLPAHASSPPRQGGAAPDAGRTTAPGTARSTTRRVTPPPTAGPGAGLTDDATTGPTGDRTGDPTEDPPEESGPTDDPTDEPPVETGPFGHVEVASPGPCDNLPMGSGPYRPFVGSAGGLCWQVSTGWRPLEMSGLHAEPQDITAVDVGSGRAVFFTATDNYVWGTVVDGGGTIAGWHQFRTRADGYASGFNISDRQPVTAVAASSDQVEIFAVGLDEVVWYRMVNTGDPDSGPGWRTLLDTHTFADGGRFRMQQTLGVANGNVIGQAKNNHTYQACYPSLPGDFRWVVLGQPCPALLR